MNQIQEQISFSPAYNLADFAQKHLAEEAEYDEFTATITAKGPESFPVFVTVTSGEFQMRHMHHEMPAPSDAFKRHCALKELFRIRLFEELRSGDFEVSAIAPGKLVRERVEADLIVKCQEVDFVNDQIGSFTLVQIQRTSGQKSFVRLVHLIEQVCAWIEPKMGKGRDDIEELCENVLGYDIPTERFKAAWTAAAKLPGWSNGGRPRKG